MSKLEKNENDPTEFIKYMLGVILCCYRNFESRTKFVRENKVAKSYDIVKKYVINKIGIFTKREVLTECPKLSSSSVESALKKLVDKGFIRKIGKGKNTHYVKI